MFFKKINQKYFSTKSISVIFIVLSSIVSFALSSLFHFAYSFLNHNRLAACFFPVNESIWEHLKLCFYPIIVVWSLSWFLFFKKKHTHSELLSWMSFSTTVNILIVLFGYYGLLSGFLISGFLVDLSLLFIGIVIGQCLATHLLHQHAIQKRYIFFFFYLLLIALLFAFLTFYPPDLPVFLSH